MLWKVTSKTSSATSEPLPNLPGQRQDDQPVQGIRLHQLLQERGRGKSHSGPQRLRLRPSDPQRRVGQAALILKSQDAYLINVFYSFVQNVTTFRESRLQLNAN